MAQQHKVAGVKTQRWDRLAQATGLQRGQALWRENQEGFLRSAVLCSQRQNASRERKPWELAAEGLPDEAHTCVGRGAGRRASVWPPDAVAQGWTYRLAALGVEREGLQAHLARKSEAGRRATRPVPGGRVLPRGTDTSEGQL